MAAVIETRGLRKSYGKVCVLDGVDIDVQRGEIFALLGPNGAGKTTMVNILSTLIKADGGSARVAGHDVDRESFEVRSSLSLTGQFAAVDDFQTGAENLTMMAKLAHFPRSMRRSRVANLIEQFDLGDAAARRVNTYSGGMRRRLDLAISMIAAPPIVFLDEPTTGLDPRSRTQLWEVVRDLAAAGTTILLTTQYLEEADKLADTISVLNAGVIVATGTAEQLKAGIDGDHVILTFEDAESFAAARALGFGSDAQFDDEASTLRIPTRHAVTSTREVLARCDEFSISVSAISIEKPTLDDVFLSLTGADARGAVAA